MSNSKSEFIIEVNNLTVGYDRMVILHDINFKVKRGEIFVILGASGCGKSTLLKNLIGLYTPVKGEILINNRRLTGAKNAERVAIMKDFGVLYQSGALFNSLTLLENITLVLEEHSDLKPKERVDRAREKLALVNLEGYENFYPNSISGGMKKRAGLARAMALNPELLFFDEPSAGLDPISSASLDRLLIDLSQKHGTTLVVVTHELDSIFAISNRVIMLDRDTKTIIAEGNPEELKENSPNPLVRKFLTRDGLLNVKHF